MKLNRHKTQNSGLAEKSCPALIGLNDTILYQGKISLRQHVIIPLSGLYVSHGLHAFMNSHLTVGKIIQNFKFHVHRFQPHRSMFETRFPHYPQDLRNLRILY